MLLLFCFAFIKEIAIFTLVENQENTQTGQGSKAAARASHREAANSLTVRQMPTHLVGSAFWHSGGW